ncbi:MAG: hypothetical protein WKF75_21265, partial [Singulisphaera sp.]
ELDVSAFIEGGEFPDKRPESPRRYPGHPPQGTRTDLCRYGWRAPKLDSNGLNSSPPHEQDAAYETESHQGDRGGFGNGNGNGGDIDVVDPGLVGSPEDDGVEVGEVGKSDERRGCQARDGPSEEPPPARLPINVMLIEGLVATESRPSRRLEGERNPASLERDVLLASKPKNGFRWSTNAAASMTAD